MLLILPILGTLGGAATGNIVGGAIGGALGGPAGATLGKAVGSFGGAVAGHKAFKDSVDHKLTDSVLRGIAEEVGIAVEDLESYDAIEEKLNMFANYKKMVRVLRKLQKNLI